jgi:hypothetical protein
LITVHRSEQVLQLAHQYVKTYILFPSGLVGLPCLIGGVGGLGYQLIATDSYTWHTFYQSSGLVVLGVAIGVVQTRYQQYLLKQFPEVFAARIRDRIARRRGKSKKDSQPTDFEHPGRSWIPLAYVIGMAILLGSAVAAYLYGQVSAVPALLLPWAGFYWARLFFWRSVIK